MVCLRNISVDTLHKGNTEDNDDDDDNNNNNNNNNNNRSTITDKTIPFNRPDITFMNKKTKKTFLIDIAVPSTHNIARTITDKQNKYQELANEICAMWKQNILR
jgi:hypothetical protein